MSDSQGDTPQTPQTPSSRADRGRPAAPKAAALAALLAVAALGVAGWLAWQQQLLGQRLGEAAGSQARIEEAERAAAASQREVEALRGDIETLRRQLEGRQRDAAGAEERLTGELTRLRESQARALDTLRDEMSAWPLRLSDLEDSIAGLRGVSDDARRRWLRAEAEYFLNIASTELTLTADVERASRALELADARLRQIDEPALNPVRGAIAREQAALAAVPRIDRAGISLRLAGLAAGVDALPLPEPAPGIFSAPRPTGPDEAAPGLERAWATLREAVSAMVSVRRDDAPLTPQLAPGDVFFLRRNLELQLENARLALLQRESALYRDHLQTAIGWLEAWFDTADPAVAGMGEALAELAAIDVAPRLPTIEESLRRLRDSGRQREPEP